MKKLIIILIALIVLLLIVALVLIWKYTDNTSLQVTEYKICNKKIPIGFDGYRIAQVSDLHNTEFGVGNEALIALLRESNPDIIVFTGDQIDARETDLDVVRAFVTEAVQIAPCYLVTGNHEGSVPGMTEFNIELQEAGVTVLEDEIVTLQHNDDTISLIGLNDPTITNRFLQIGQEGSLAEVIEDLSPAPEGYSVLLAHRPEYLQLYANLGVDLALCGHAHGGQIRIKDQGLFDPHQGLFPKYDAGIYTMSDTTMVLSRGLGNSLFPWRINNPPELVVVELSAQE